MRIAVSSLHHLGDLMAKIPLFSILKKNLKCHLRVIVQEGVIPLAKKIPLIDEVYSIESLIDLKDQIAFFEKTEAFLEIPSRERAIGPSLMPGAIEAKVPLRIGYKRGSFWKSHFKKRGMTHVISSPRIIPGLHEAKWTLQYLKPFKLSPGSDTPSFLFPPSLVLPQVKEYLVPGSFNLILHPGSLGNAKEWPFYGELISKLDPRISILVTGSQEEKKRFSHLDHPRVTFCMGELNLEEFLNLIEHAQGLISGSTGPAHMAAAFGKRVWTLFPKQEGMSSAIWAPLGPHVNTIESSVICSSCHNRLSELNPRLCKCMEGISVLEVLKTIEVFYENPL